MPVILDLKQVFAKNRPVPILIGAWPIIILHEHNFWNRGHRQDTSKETTRVTRKHLYCITRSYCKQDDEDSTTGMEALQYEHIFKPDNG